MKPSSPPPVFKPTLRDYAFAGIGSGASSPAGSHSHSNVGHGKGIGTDIVGGGGTSIELQRGVSGARSPSPSLFAPPKPMSTVYSQSPRHPKQDSSSLIPPG